MRERSSRGNPVLRGVVNQNSQGNQGYAGFNYGNAAGMGQAAWAQQQGQPNQYANPYGQDQYARPGQPVGTRPLTIDDIVTKTAMTLGTVVLFGVVAYFLSHHNNNLAGPLAAVGAIGGFVLVMIATFGRRQNNPAIVLSYAALEGLFVGAISFVFGNWGYNGNGVTVGAGALVIQAIIGTIGVFFGMLVVYKTGAIRVTPRFTRYLLAALIGVVVLIVVNLIAGIFMDGGLGLRDGGPIAYIFSFVCILLGAFMLLQDFDSADRAVQAGAPQKAAWGLALGLTITLVWLYIEILRLLSYIYSDN